MGDGGWREGAHMSVASMRNNLEAKCNKQSMKQQITMGQKLVGGWLGAQYSLEGREVGPSRVLLPCHRRIV